MRVLIGSPVRQKPTVLNEFLKGLDEMEKSGIAVSFFFVDDNIDKQSRQLLLNFSQMHDVVLVMGNQLSSASDLTQYDCNSFTHYWDVGAIEKIALFKDTIIRYCLSNEYDYLFLVDSDIVLHRNTLRHLISRELDIVSNVFWTQWLPNQGLYPQIFWIPNLNDRVLRPFSGASVNIQEVRQLEKDFYTKMMVPGLYEVEGLGACTLISREALKKGVRFERVPNLVLNGEDRHFCIRAGVLGIPLYLDTVYPAYHIYREEYLSRVDEYKRDGFKFDMCQSYTKNDSTQHPKEPEYIRMFKRGLNYIKRKIDFRGNIERQKEKQKESELRITYDRNKRNSRIVLQMIVRNECGRYLEAALNSVAGFVDYYVIIDDASTDGTLQLCEKLLSNYPHTIVHNEKSLFHIEYKLRQELWDEMEKHNPGWVLSIDADEVMQEGAGTIIRSLIQSDSIDCYRFKYYDMWNEDEYRDDRYWHSHNGYRPYLFRYEPNHKYNWKKTNQHCGSFPIEALRVSYANINLKIKHFGWARKEDREAKYKRYMELDGKGIYGDIGQYQSILDDNPNLRRFDELQSGL